MTAVTATGERAVARYKGGHVRVGVCCRFDRGVSLGEDGFGYEQDEQTGHWTRREHPFGVVIGDRVEVGANTVIHRGRWRDTIVGTGSKIDAGVFLAHNVQVGHDCLIVAHAMLAGSVTLGDRVIVGGGALVKQGVTVGDDAIVGLGAVVVADVAAGAVVVGNPARYLRDRRPGETL